MYKFLTMSARWAALLTMIVMIALVPQSVQAAPIACTAPCDSDALNTAIASAAPGDVIEVPAGTFQLTTLVNVNKAVTIQGAGAGETVFEVNGSGHRIAFNADGSGMGGVEVLKTDKTTQNILYIAANNVTLQNIEVHGQWVMGEGEVSRAIEAVGGKTGIVIADSVFYGLRQPGYLNTSLFTIQDNLVYGTRGWVLEGANVTFTGNTWGTGADVNAVDIAILAPTASGLYPDLLAISAANNDAVIEDQRAGGGLTHVWVDDSAAVSGNGYQISPYPSIQAGVNRVIAGGKLFVAAGTYLENTTSWHDLFINKSLSMIGAGKDQTIVKLTAGKTNGVEIRGDNLNVTLEGMTFTRRDGSDFGPGFGLRIAETTSSFTGFTLRDVEVSYMNGRNVQFGAAGTYTGIVIEDSDFHHAGSWGMSIDGPTTGLTVTGSTFTDNGLVDATHGVGLDLGNGGITNVVVEESDFSRNTMKGVNLVKTTNALFDDITVDETGPTAQNSAFTIWEWAGSESSNITIQNSQFRNNNRMAILLGTEPGNTISDVTVVGNVFSDNGMGAIFNWGAGTLDNVVAHHNSIVNAGTGIFTNQPQFPIAAENNWWGCNEGPAHADCTAVSDGVDADPWLVLSTLPQKSEVQPGETMRVTGSLTINSEDEETYTSGSYVYPRTLRFTANPGTMDPTSYRTYRGRANSDFTAAKANGTASVCVLLDNETTCVDIEVANIAPVAVADAYTMDQGDTLTTAKPGVLANDTDENETVLEAVLVADAAHGDLTLNADGSFTYTPDPFFYGEDTFTYKASDGEQESNTVTVTITVETIQTESMFLPVILKGWTGD